MKLIITICLSSSLLTGCLSYIPDRDRTPWDPPHGSHMQLFDQLPNLPGESARACCGRDPTQCRGQQQPNC